jgi:hypothetical protein
MVGGGAQTSHERPKIRVPGLASESEVRSHFRTEIKVACPFKLTFVKAPLHVRHRKEVSAPEDFTGKMLHVKLPIIEAGPGYLEVQIRLVHVLGGHTSGDPDGGGFREVVRPHQPMNFRPHDSGGEIRIHRADRIGQPDHLFAKVITPRRRGDATPVPQDLSVSEMENEIRKGKIRVESITTLVAEGKIRGQQRPKISPRTFGAALN